MSGEILMTKVLGLTGGIATGKSTADAFFKKKGLPIIDSDQIAHHIYDPGKPAYAKIVTVFGKEVLADDQTINRKKLGQIVFADAQKLDELNQITHPLIYQEIDQQIVLYRKKKVPLVILDAPVLYETHGEGRCDWVLVISLPEGMQLQRLMKRNNLSQKEAQKRIDSQMPLTEKSSRANYLIENTGTIEELEEKLEKLLLKLRAEG